MIVAAHQPAYWPWLGYLHKMASCDIFVVMDDVQYESQNFQNRNRVKVNNGVAWITVPLCHGSRDERIVDKRIENSGSLRQHWCRRTWRTLNIHYGRAPFFLRYADQIHRLYTRTWDSLIDLDLHVLGLLRDWFGISTPIIRSSELGLNGQKSDRIIDMCRKVQATTYLSGRGGSLDYLDRCAFQKASLDLSWQDFTHPIYRQCYTHLGFFKNLSSLDLLFNCGPDSKQFLLNQSHSIYRREV